MPRTPLYLAALSALVIIAGAACSSAVPAVSAPSNPQPQSGAPAESPAAPVNPQPGTSLAPVCQSATSCQAPAADQVEVDCVKKIPYTNVLIQPGTSFEVVDQSGNFTCLDSGLVSNGKQVIACHGPELHSFDLKLTNASCGGSNLVTGTGQCQQGYGYDAAGQCCAPISGASGGSTTITVDLGGCPIPRQP